MGIPQRNSKGHDEGAIPPGGGRIHASEQAFWRQPQNIRMITVKLPTEREKCPMYCRKCGKTIPEDSVFCPYCAVPTDPGHRNAKKGARSLVFLSTLTLIAVIAALACVIMVIRQSDRAVATEETAPPESTLSTLPPETTETEPNGATEETGASDPSGPWRHVDSMEEAEAILGFGLMAPDMVKDFEAPWINVAPDCLNLWASYRRYTEEHDPMYYDKIITVGHSIYIVKYPCPEGVVFVSPDNKQKLIQVDGNDVILTMDGVEVVGADWAAGGYAYSLSFENMGLTAYSVVPLISQTH